MFQDTRRSPSAQLSSAQGGSPQQEERRDREQQAQLAVEESARRMMSEAQLRSLEIQRQSIDGRVEEVRAKERLGASAEEVAARTKQDAVGSLDFALSQLSPPSLNEDKRGEIRLAYMRAVDTRAKEIEAKQLDQQERARVEKRSELEQQQRDPSLVLAA